MKKYVLILAMVVLSKVSLAQENKEVLFECNDGSNGGSIIQIKKDFMKDMAKIQYNFSTADLVCYDVEFKIKNGQEIVCSGIWSFDFDTNGGALNTLVMLTVKPLANGQWETQYRTSISYGALPIQQTCSAN